MKTQKIGLFWIGSILLVIFFTESLSLIFNAIELSMLSGFVLSFSLAVAFLLSGIFFGDNLSKKVYHFEDLKEKSIIHIIQPPEGFVGTAEYVYLIISEEKKKKSIGMILRKNDFSDEFVSFKTQQTWIKIGHKLYPFNK